MKVIFFFLRHPPFGYRYRMSSKRLRLFVSEVGQLADAEIVIADAAREFVLWRSLRII